MGRQEVTVGIHISNGFLGTAATVCTELQEPGFCLFKELKVPCHLHWSQASVATNKVLLEPSFTSDLCSCRDSFQGKIARLSVLSGGGPRAHGGLNLHCPFNRRNRKTRGNLKKNSDTLIKVLRRCQALGHVTDIDFLLTPRAAVFSPLQRLGAASPSENVLNVISSRPSSFNLQDVLQDLACGILSFRNHWFTCLLAHDFNDWKKSNMMC